MIMFYYFFRSHKISKIFKVIKYRARVRFKKLIFQENSPPFSLSRLYYSNYINYNKHFMRFVRKLR